MMPQAVNAPILILMVNDIGGRVWVSENYLWIQFVGENQLEFRINGAELYKKIIEGEDEIRVNRSLTIFPDVAEEEGVDMTVIYMENTKRDNDQAEIPTWELKEALYCLVS